MKKYSVSKKAWIEIALAFGLFAAFAVLAGIYDLVINKALYNPDSLFGQFFARLGEMPSYLAAPAAGAILYRQGLGKAKWQKLVIGAFFILLTFGGWFFALSAWFWENFVNHSLPYAMVYKLFFSAFMTLLTLLCVSFVDKKAIKKLLPFAVFLIIVTVVSNVIVQIMKMGWARQRFRTMVGSGDFSGFAPWYKPQFLFPSPVRTPEYIAAVKAADSDAFRSFPSGHTVAAAASFAIIILPEMYKGLKKYALLFWIAPIAYTVAVAVSRIVMGAHYLSDVLFGGYIGFGTAALARFVIVRKYPHKLSGE
jgi:membrane-associated phospholipid phosphatase